MSIKSVATVFALLAAAPALAQPSLDVKPDKVFQSRSYYQATGSKMCDGSSGCSVYFPKIDGKDGVIFRHVSCTVSHAAPIFLAGLGVADKKGDDKLDPSVALQIPAAVLNGAVRYTQINQEVLFRVPGGSLPAVAVLTTEPGIGQLYCVISGEPG